MHLSGKHNGQEPDLSTEEIGQIGLDIYRTQLKDILEPEHVGKWVAIHLTTAEYFLGNTITEAARKARAAYSEDLFFIMRVAEDDD